MVKRNPSRPVTAADELAAKLAAITEAATGLWRSGVTKVVLDGVTVDLQEPPPVPTAKTDEDAEADDPLSLAAFRRAQLKGKGS